MTLGEKLRSARVEAGLSQRQLCGEEITRNMLSQIEHGTAKPSMGTLQYLAGRLGKTVSWFLEEDAVFSPNMEVMASARRSFDEGLYAAAAVELERFRGPDGVYDRERELMEAVCRMALAEEAIGQEKGPYARELLEKIQIPAWLPELERRRLLLLGQVCPAGEIVQALPSLDEELLLRSRGALEQGDAVRAAELLEAAQDRESPRWNLLRGKAYMALQQYRPAAECLHKAEDWKPKETAGALEVCWRELGDFQKAYFYACRQRE